MADNVIGLSENTELYARKKTDKDGNDLPKAQWQTLDGHLKNVAALSSSFCGAIGLERTGFIAGLLHDLGKGTREFQDYLKNGGERGSVIHSLQGAVFAYKSGDNIDTLLLREVLSLVVAAHHNYLKDACSTDGREVFVETLSGRDGGRLHYEEAISNSRDIVAEINRNVAEANRELMEFAGKLGSGIYKTQDSAQFALGLAVKYIYSCLVDADRLDAQRFDGAKAGKEQAAGKEQKASAEQTPGKEQKNRWAALIKTFEDNLKELPNDGGITEIREEISQKCREAAKRKTGIYRLSVPTGGGKTLSSLRFALNHCEIHGKKRIIYVIPYLSIIEQTAKSLRKILNIGENDETVFEHHSDIVPPEDTEDDNVRKLAAARWQSPVIITTMVQFLETVMSSKASKIRKFHNMSDAVIIFDEIQSLPIKAINLFNEVVSFLSKFCGATVLLCTATPPRIDKTGRKNLLLSDKPDLIDDTEKSFASLKRTRIVIEQERDIRAFSEFALQKTEENGNCLVILNTKGQAREAFDFLKSKANGEFDVFHLSAAMCSAHRSDVLNKIRKKLEEGQKLVCVATQLIEAGVDISFDCVARAMAGLDSVAQAAGRCNRNGEKKTPRDVYAVPIKGEDLEKLHDIKKGKEITSRLVRENPDADFLDGRIMDKFYEGYFFGRESEMDCKADKGGTVYAMLSSNGSGRGNYKNNCGKDPKILLAQAFHTADDNFSVIADNTVSVVALYGEAESLIAAYKKQPKNAVTGEKLSIIKRLGRYCVSLYAYEAEELDKKGALSKLDDDSGIYILNKDYYSDETGATRKAELKDLIA
ncbi:MAG: CRISPR-associated helicase Cas3' [Clostridiales bacterium]|jgi:CRISPR-associated endonuclease/helicase Cas3|nr:CRISPR-associated helicase Cas3' [Clostridiales bacterium]